MKKDDVENLILQHVASAVVSSFEKIQESKVEQELESGVIESLKTIITRIDRHKEDFANSLKEVEDSLKESLTKIEEKVEKEAASTAILLERIMTDSNKFKDDYEPSIKKLKKREERYSALAFNVLSAVFVSTAIAVVALVGNNIINK